MDEIKNGIIRLPAGDASGKKLFPINMAITVGRDAGNDIVIPNLNISRKHAKFYRDERGVYWIEDMGSHNGTLLNGRLARREKLQAGDIISIADCEMHFEFTNEDQFPAASAKITNEDLGVMACDSTKFIDLSELKKESMEELRKQKPSITNPWKES